MLSERAFAVPGAPVADGSRFPSHTPVGMEPRTAKFKAVLQRVAQIVAELELILSTLGRRFPLAM